MEYIKKLFINNDIDWLFHEKRRLKEIVSKYNEQLQDTLSKKKILDIESKIEYDNNNISKLKKYINILDKE